MSIGRNVSAVKQSKALAVVKQALHAVQILLEAIESPEASNDESSKTGFVDPLTYLSESVSQRVINRACRDGELKASKRGRKWLARPSDIDAWVEASKKEESPVSSDADALIASWRKSGGGK